MNYPQSFVLSIGAPVVAFGPSPQKLMTTRIVCIFYLPMIWGRYKSAFGALEALETFTTQSFQLKQSLKK